MRSRTFWGGSATLLLIGAANIASAETLTAGINDNFSAPADAVAPSAELTAFLADFNGTQAYDLTAGINGGSANRQVAHTFGPFGSDIVEAFLEIHIRGGNNAGVINDGIVFGFVDNDTVSFPRDIAFGRTFGPFAGGGAWFVDPDPGLFSQWLFGSEEILSLDLSELPLTGGDFRDLRPELNLHGFLDVIVTDETAVDYAVLTIVRDPIAAVGGSNEQVSIFDLTLTPNPFSSATTIRVPEKHSGYSTLTVYDSRGRRVRHMSVSSSQPALFMVVADSAVARV